MPTLTFENLNHKLLCDRFIHLAPMPPSGTLNGLVNTEYDAVEKNESLNPFKVRIIDTFKVFLDEVCGSLTWQAYGMTRVEFIKYYRDANHLTVEECGTTAVAVYFLEKIS